MPRVSGTSDGRADPVSSSYIEANLGRGSGTRGAGRSGAPAGLCPCVNSCMMGNGGVRVGPGGAGMGPGEGRNSRTFLPHLEPAVPCRFSVPPFTPRPICRELPTLLNLGPSWWAPTQVILLQKPRSLSQRRIPLRCWQCGIYNMSNSSQQRMG